MERRPLSAEALFDAHLRQSIYSAKKGGTTKLYLVLLLGRGFLRVLNEQCRLRKEQNAVLAQCIL